MLSMIVDWFWYLVKIGILVAVIISAVDYLIKRYFFSKRFQVAGKTVFISGGSMGIGKSLAMEAIKRGAQTVYILARNQSVLEEAKQELLKLRVNKDQRVITFACDVADIDQVQKVADALENDPEKKCKSLDFVFVNQGFASPGYFLQQEENVFKRATEVNYLGGVYMAKSLLPIMLRLQRTSTDSKHLVFVSSALGVLTMIGYTSYCPTKYAIKSFAECLRSEMQDEDICIQCYLPVDTQTPGFDKENETKPVETAKLSEVGGLASPDSAAKFVYDSMKSGQFILTNDIAIQLLNSMTRGLCAMSPILIVDWLITCFASAVSPLVRLYFWYVPFSMREERRQKFQQFLQKKQLSDKKRD